MTTLATDTFTRADESPIASPWSTASGLSSVNLTSNRMSTAIDGNNHGALYGGITWPDDQWCQAKLYCVSVDGVRRGPALYVRFAAGANTCYRFSTDHASSNNCNVSRFVAGVRTTIVDFTQAWTDGDTWALYVQGPSSAARVRTFYNGSQVSDNTDNSSVASGSPGAGLSGNVTMTSWSLDDFTAGDFETQSFYTSRRRMVGSRR